MLPKKTGESMQIFRCKMCGGSMEATANETVAVCEYCGTRQTLPRLDSERKANLYDRAGQFRRNNEFDRAIGIYEQILAADETDAEAYWSLVLCRYGIEYVEDPATRKRIPTVNRTQTRSIFADRDYRAALRYADAAQRAVYEAEAEAIQTLQSRILEISRKEAPFDVFICYKETDQTGRRTPDSVMAADLYHQLQKEGFKVFFSRITLEEKLGMEYEPYIFAALHSARVMVVLGTRPEHFNAPWVKNEWSRYLALIRQGEKKLLIPAYRDMDPYELPEELAYLQAQDMSRLGFMQDLIHGIKKMLPAQTAPVSQAGSEEALLKRAFLFLEDGNWKSADTYCEKVLDQNPENAMAYVGKLFAELRIRDWDMLRCCTVSFAGNSNYRKAVRYADPSLRTELEAALQVAEKRPKQEATKLPKNTGKLLRLIGGGAAALVIVLLAGLLLWRCLRPGIRYRKAESLCETGAYDQAILIWTELGDYQDAAMRLQQARYDQAVQLMDTQQFEAALTALELLSQTRDVSRELLETRYQYACARKEEGRYEEALALFAEIGDYRDRDELAQACREAYAVQLMERGAYTEALAVLQTGEASSDVQALIERCCLTLAEEACEDEDYVRAAAYLSELDLHTIRDTELFREIQYGSGVQYLREGSYQLALDAFEHCGGYLDTAELKKEAMYRCVAEEGKPDEETLAFLKQLMEEDYKDSKAIYQELFGWKMEVYAISNSEHNDTVKRTSIPKYDKIHFFCRLTGGEPGAKTNVTYKIYWLGGKMTPGEWDKMWSSGDTDSHSMWYTNPGYGTTGVHTVEYYDGAGNLIGSDSVQIVN